VPRNFIRLGHAHVVAILFELLQTPSACFVNRRNSLCGRSRYPAQTAGLREWVSLIGENGDNEYAIVLVIRRTPSPDNGDPSALLFYLNTIILSPIKASNNRKFAIPPYRKLWSSGRALGSRSEGRGFDPRPMLDGSSVKAMPGLILAPNSGSLY